MTASQPSWASRGLLRTAAMGHEDAFPGPRLSACCRFSQGTFGGRGATGETRRNRTFPASPWNGEVRPKWVIRGRPPAAGDGRLLFVLSHGIAIVNGDHFVLSGHPLARRPFSSTPHGSQTGAGFDVPGPRPVRDWRNGMRNIVLFGSGSPFAPDAMIKPRSPRSSSGAWPASQCGIPNGLDRDCRHHGVATRRSAASAGHASIDGG